MFLRDFIALDRSFLTNGSFCEEVLCWWRYHVFGDGVGEGGGSDLFRICYFLTVSLIFCWKDVALVRSFLALKSLSSKGGFRWRYGAFGD